MAEQSPNQFKFPENAYRELKPGEKFVPMVPPDATVPEFTTRMFVFGLLMNIIFSVAATFLALKAGQGIETAIPISILAVGLSGFILKAGGRASSILENVYALSISTTSGYVAGGTCFTMPAIYILHLNEPGHLDISNLSLFLQIALVPFLGAILGALFLIPFRRYFVKEMHGKLPFPEATATNEILVTGASGSTGQAWILIYSFIISAIYTFVATGLRLFSDKFTTGFAELKTVAKGSTEVLAFGDTGLFATLTNKIKAVFEMGAGAYYLGLGFIIGVRYASIICAGSFLSALALTPLLGSLDFERLVDINPAFKSQHGEIEERVRFVLPAEDKAFLDELTTLCKAPGGETEEEKTARYDTIKPVLAQLEARFAEHDYKLRLDRVSEVKVKSRGEDKGWEFVDERRGFVIEPAEAGYAVRAYEPSAHDVWFQIPRIIGIGAIFTAGLLSILKMSKVIAMALRQALGGLLSGKGGHSSGDRTDEDISYPTMLLLGLAAVVIMFFFFRFVVFANMANPMWLTLVSVVLALVIAFLFTTVSAWAIAMISVTPISGMTVTTIIITAVLMMWAGLEKGDGGMLAVLLVGGVVCTALSMAGGLVTNFKMAYWLGASPKRITWNALFGSLVSAVCVCGTIMILAANPGYTGPDALSAPQANMMSGALESFLGTGDVPWLLYGVGVMVALTMELIGVSALAFGLGMYLPMYINTPILIGAFVAALVKKSTSDEKLSKARSNKGILLASGLIAGGAIMEVIVNMTGALDDMKLDKAIMKFLDVGGHLVAGGTDPAMLARVENWLGLILFFALCIFVYFDCKRAKAELAEGGELG